MFRSFKSKTVRCKNVEELERLLYAYWRADRASSLTTHFDAEFDITAKLGWANVRAYPVVVGFEVKIPMFVWEVIEAEAVKTDTEEQIFSGEYVPVRDALESLRQLREDDGNV